MYAFTHQIPFRGLITLQILRHISPFVATETGFASVVEVIFLPPICAHTHHLDSSGVTIDNKPPGGVYRSRKSTITWSYAAHP